ncbi:MAG: hypothetical protein HRT54_06655 [Colwellia sp.]|nr:hypothetical protein [Colwellia sp.]
MLSRLRNKDNKLAKYKWNVDCLNSEKISGWAYNTAKKSKSAKVEVRTGDTVLWSSIADGFRQDLLDAKIGNGHYSFTITPDNNPVSIAFSTVDIYIDGIKAETELPYEIVQAKIEEEEKLVQAKIEEEELAQAKIEEEEELAQAKIEHFRIQLDQSAIDKVAGWVFNPENSTYRAKIEIRCGDTVVACGLANEYRQDLTDAGIGDGTYAFTLTPNLSLFPHNECECKLFVDGVDADNESFTLVTDTESRENAKYQEEFSSEILDFTQSITDKLGSLKEDIVSSNKSMNEDDFAVNGQLNVAINSIAELSVRISVIEQVLLKRLSKA